MSKSKYRVLVLGSYPAPYRIAVFRGLAEEYDLDIFFDTNKNEDRNKDWFGTSGDIAFDVLNSEESNKKFKHALKNIKKYKFVVSYDPLTTPALKAEIACRMKGVPYFVNCDGAIRKKHLVKDMIKRFIFKGACACFASGEQGVEYFSSYGVKKERIFKHNFTSLSDHDILSEIVSEKEKAELRDELCIPDGLVVLSIGQFIPRKGFDILVKAWKEIGDKATLLLIGGGYEEQSYLEYISEHNIKGISIIGFKNKETIFKYYKASDIFVLPTREDIWGLVINEAMANGLPVITTDNCVAGLELIDNDINGYIVKTESVEELGAKLSHLLDNEELRTKMAINNLDKISSWTIESVVKSHLEVIKQKIG